MLSNIASAHTDVLLRVAGHGFWRCWPGLKLVVAHSGWQRAGKDAGATKARSWVKGAQRGIALPRVCSRTLQVHTDVVYGSRDTGHKPRLLAMLAWSKSCSWPILGGKEPARMPALPRRDPGERSTARNCCVCSRTLQGHTDLLLRITGHGLRLLAMPA